MFGLATKSTLLRSSIRMSSRRFASTNVAGDLSAISHATEAPVTKAEIYSVPKTPAEFPAFEKVMLKEDYEHVHHAKTAGPTWTKINLILTLPILIACAFYVIPKEKKHIDHLLEHPKEFVPFAHLRKRKNPYPWGDDNLFYCPEANPKPAQ